AVHHLRRLDADPPGNIAGADAAGTGRASVGKLLAGADRGLARRRRGAGRPHDAEQPGDGARHRAWQDRDLDHRLVRHRVFPFSKTSMAALFVIQFIYGSNQYLWPLLITTQESMYTAVIGIKRMITGGDALTEWNLVMATAMLALLPPAAVVVLMQRWFVKGLVETEK